MSTLTSNKIDINIGIEENDRETISKALSQVLADSYMVYIKSHNYHWNVTGHMFHSLHELFEEQYTELADAIDEIAERIRALGFRAPGTTREFNELSNIEEDTSTPKALDMVRNLAEDHEKVIRDCRKALKPAESADDEVTIDLLVERMEAHSQAAWMLRSILEE